MNAVIVVLAGGGSLRLGQDKLAVPLAGSTVLEHLLSGLGEVLPALPVVLVGPARDVDPSIAQVREVPAGGGPVAALARALQVPTTRSADLIGVLAGDQPFAAPALAYLFSQRAILDTDTDTDTGTGTRPDAVLAVDSQGRWQPLLGLYRAGPLRAAIGDEPAGRSMRSVLALLQVAELAVPAQCTLDVDTPDDLARVRRVAASAADPPPAPAAPHR